MVKKKFRVTLGRLVREQKEVIVEAESEDDIDLHDAYENADDEKGWEPDVEFGCAEGSHDVVGEEV